MPAFIIKRAYLDNGTFGKMYHKGEFICYTLERPWLSNKPFVSCVPPGEYKMCKHVSPKFGDCFYFENSDLGVELNGLAIRTYILMHPANYVSQLQGCISVGLRQPKYRWGVADSKKAMTLVKSIIIDIHDEISVLIE